MAQIKWINGAGGDFGTASNWMGGVVPGAADDAVFNLAGPYTVTSGANETVNSLQMIAGITLAINAGTFTATNGSGSGVANGAIAIADNADFVVGGTLAGSGTVSLNGTYYGANFLINSATTTISGGGTIAMGDFSANRLYANTAGERLVNTNDTITGAGLLGNGNMALTNSASGIINASAAGNQLVLNVGTYGANNAGLIEATGTAGLTIQNSVITQTGTGTLKAINSVIDLNGATVIGGTLTSTGTGVIQDVNSAELNAIKLSAGTVAISDNANLYLDNTITNAGTIFQGGTYYGTYLEINTGAVTLTGSGKVIMSDVNGSNRIVAAAAGNKLVNLNNIISGSGQIGNGSTLSIDNRAAGIINSNGTGGLTINTPGIVTNEGLLEDTGTGGLGINTTTITNTGTIAAYGTLSHVDLYNSSSIIGGTLVTTGGGIIQIAGAGTLDGSTKTGAITIATGSIVQVDDNQSLYLNGSIVNHGTIFQLGTYYGTNTVVNTPTVTLSGGGTVLWSDNNASNRIIAAGTTGYKLVNIDNTIIGSGQIGNGSSLAITNQATINSNGTTGLTINTPVGISNSGLLEDTGTGGLGIANTVLTNTGTLAAFGAGTHVDLYGSDIVGGTLSTNGGGIIQVTGGSSLDGTGGITITAGSVVQTNDNQALYLDGTITNAGTILANGTYNGGYLVANSATVTLTGSGLVVLSDLSGNTVTAGTAGDKLVNLNNTIQGSGRIGNGTALAIDNHATINSNGNSGLTINTPVTLTNEGLIEDTGTGGLDIQSTTVANTGTISASGAGAVTQLSGADIVGGTLVTSNGGLIVDNSSTTLDGTGSGGITIATASTVETTDNQALYLDGTITNQGTLSQYGTYNGAYLYINTGTVTLTGGGGLLLSDSINNRILAVANGNKLVNFNETISGTGLVGGNGGGVALNVDNQAAGIIDATGGGALTFNLSAAGSAGLLTNEGLMESTSTGGLSIVSTTLDNFGTLAAIGAGANVDFTSADIVGGLLTASGGGVFNNANSTLDSGSGTITIATGTVVQTGDNQSLYLDNTITNKGTIFQAGTYNGAFLYINTATVTLTGGGNLLLSDNTNNRIIASASGDKLVNFNETISGSGLIGGNGGGNALNIDNQAAGVIDATGSGELTFNLSAAGSAGVLTNEGLLESTSSGGLAFVNTTVTNTGTIAAIGAGAHVDLSGADIVGGLLTASGGGIFNDGNNATLDGGTTTLTIAAGTTVQTGDNQNFYLDRTITNKGTIFQNGTYNGAFLYINTPIVTLTGGGALTLTNNSNNTILATTNDNQLVNFNNTITGAGRIGGGGGGNALYLDNQKAGLIDANGSGALNISLAGAGNAGIFTNEGTAEATGTGGLIIQGTTLTNTGTIAAMLDSAVTITNDTVTNLVGGKLTGGTWEAISSTASGHTSVLSLSGGPITNDAAHLVLSGIGSSITANGVALETSLVTIAAAGELDILGGRNFASTQRLIDNGTIVLSGTLSAVSLTTGATGQLTATGASVLAPTKNLANAGTLQASGGGTLTINHGTLTNTGTVAALAGSTVSIIATTRIANLVAGTLTGGTWLASGSGATLLLGTGPLSVDAATLTLSGAGSTIKSGSGAKTLEQSLTTIAAGGQLNVLAGRVFASTAGALSDAGLITLGGGSFSGGALTIASTGTFAGGGTLASAVTDNGLLASQSVSGITTLTVNTAIGGTGALLAETGTTLIASAGFAIGTVTVQSGATLQGTGSATGAILVDGTLALATTGTLTGGTITTDAGGLIEGAGTIATTIANSGTIEALNGTLTLAAGETGGALLASAAGATPGALISTTAIAAATLSIDAGASFTGFGSVSGLTTDNGTLSVSSADLTLGAISGTGNAIITSGATLTSTGSLANAALTFAAGSNEVLALGTAHGDSATISGFANGTTIDITNTTVTSLSFAPAKDQLALKNGTTTLGVLQFAGAYTAKNFTLQSDGHGGTDIVYSSTGAAIPLAATPDTASPATDLHQAATLASAAPTTPAITAPASLPVPTEDLGARMFLDHATYAGMELHIGR